MGFLVFFTIYCSMKFLINENQYGNLKNRLQKSINDYGLITTIERYKLPFEVFDKILDGGNNYDCDTMADLVVYFLKMDMVKKRHYINGGRFEINLWRESGSGILAFNFKDNMNDDALIGYATPYYDSECSLPIDYENFVTEEEEFYVSGENSSLIKLSPKKGVSELLNWINNDYPKIISKRFIRDLEYFKNHY